MKKIHIAMVGRTVENVVRGIGAIGAIDAGEGIELYPILSKECTESLEKLREHLSGITIHERLSPAGPNLVIDPFQDEAYYEIIGLISDIVQKIQLERKQAKPSYEVEIWVNITGGTNLMSAAASAGAILTNSKAYYVPEKSPKPIIIPWHSLTSTEICSLQQSILINLVGQELFNEEIRTLLADKKKNRAHIHAVSKRSITYHLKELARHGYIVRTKKGRHTLNHLTTNGKIAARFLTISLGQSEPL